MMAAHRGCTLARLHNSEVDQAQSANSLGSSWESKGGASLVPPPVVVGAVLGDGGCLLVSSCVRVATAARTVSCWCGIFLASLARLYRSIAAPKACVLPHAPAILCNGAGAALDNP
jgi:hypothetical protein